MKCRGVENQPESASTLGPSFDRPLPASGFLLPSHVLAPSVTTDCPISTVLLFAPPFPCPLACAKHLSRVSLSHCGRPLAQACYPSFGLLFARLWHRSGFRFHPSNGAPVCFVSPALSTSSSTEHTCVSKYFAERILPPSGSGASPSVGVTSGTEQLRAPSSPSPHLSRPPSAIARPKGTCRLRDANV